LTWIPTTSSLTLTRLFIFGGIMDERSFRLSLVVLLAIFVVGVLGIGWRFTESTAQNGRFIQFDLGKTSLPQGGTSFNKYERWAIDTRTGQVLILSNPEK
jgi:hypothetical protein